MPFTSVLIENVCVITSLYISASKTAFMRSSRSDFLFVTCHICHISTPPQLVPRDWWKGIFITSMMLIVSLYKYGAPVSIFVS